MQPTPESGRYVTDLTLVLDLLRTRGSNPFYLMVLTQSAPANGRACRWKLSGLSGRDRHALIGTITSFDPEWLRFGRPKMVTHSRRAPDSNRHIETHDRADEQR